MAYHHVFASDRDSPQRFELLLSDLTVPQLKKQFLGRYAWARPVWANLRMYNPAEFATVRIVRTQVPLEVLREELTRKNREETDRLNKEPGGLPNVASGEPDAQQLIKAGEDLTERYIFGPPGESVLAMISPLVSKLIVGVVVAVVTVVLTWWLNQP